MDQVLTCQGLVKRFGERLAVHDVGFAIAPGETYGLLGPNGAGKTTTISMLCGLLERDAGRVEVAGFDLDQDPRSVKAAIGYVPQDLAIYPDLTGRENLRFFGRLQGLSGPELNTRVNEVLEVVGLADRAEDPTDDYSGGMKRRLNIGVGLLHEPQLLVLDEPTVGVDPQSRNSILESVEQLGSLGMAVLYTTHYMEEAERLCDRVGVMDLGQLVAEGTRRELVEMIGGTDRVRIRIERDGAELVDALEALDTVAEAHATDDMVELTVRDGHSALPGLLTAADDAGARVTSVELVEPDLESVFLALTGKALRD
ncbi:MAG: ABC transporter ATP-binding protein [Actinomycetia bacterium]|nr:ABC transporter ATP-binding protein [Actinomycetes bacterium]